MCRCHICSSPALPVLATDMLFWAALGWSLAEAAAELRVRHPWWPAVPAGLATPALIALCAKVGYVRAQLRTPWYIDAKWNARVAIVPLVGALANTFTLAGWLFALPYYVGELAADGVGVGVGAPSAHEIDADVAAATTALLRRPSSVLLCITYALTLCCACVAASAHRRALVAQLEAIDAVPLLADDDDDDDAYGALNADEPAFLGGRQRPSAPRDTMTRAELGRAFVPEKAQFDTVELSAEEIGSIDSTPLSTGGGGSLLVDNLRPSARAPAPDRAGALRIDSGLAGDETSDTAVASDAPLDSPRRRRRSRRGGAKKKAH